MPDPNLSFETAGASQGDALSWTSAVSSAEEGIAVFGDTGAVWDPAENFERHWRLPYCVHYRTDPDHLISALDASDEPSALTLVGAIVLAYRAHLLTEDEVHLSVDLTWIAYFSPPEGLDQAMLEANVIKFQLYNTGSGGFPQGHLSNWPLVHRREDIQNRITSPDATALPSLIVLANELKLRFNAHLNLTGYGDFNESGRFSFSAGDLDPCLIRDLNYESFERGWAIPDMVPNKIAAQTDMVSPGPPNRWGSFRWGQGAWGGPPSWPGGHEQFLSSFDMVESERGLLETMERGWLLPGSTFGKTNDKFLARFYDAIEEMWRFTSLQLYLGIIDDFEGGWKHNEEGKSWYWDGTEWRFLPGQIELGGVLPESFESGWTLVLPT